MDKNINDKEINKIIDEIIYNKEKEQNTIIKKKVNIPEKNNNLKRKKYQKKIKNNSNKIKRSRREIFQPKKSRRYGSKK